MTGKPFPRLAVALTVAVGAISPAAAAAAHNAREIHHKRQSGPQTILASRQSGPGGLGANANSKADSISLNGRWVVFDSAASNLAGPHNGVQRVYARDTKTGRTILVSRNSGGHPANRNSFGGSISASGKFVTFASDATNLGSHNQRMNVYVRDLRTRETVLVSRRSGTFGAEANGNSFGATMSTDGKFVSFTSAATNLGADNGATNVYVRDLRSGQTALVSRQSGVNSSDANGPSFEASISPHGRYVVFVSDATNLGSGTTTTGTDEIYVRDRKTHTTSLVSRASGATGGVANGHSDEPTVSLLGHRVAFSSTATNLSSDAAAVRNVYVRDLTTEQTVLVSRADGPTGAAGNADSGNPSISADGRFVAFASSATNLKPEALHVRNVYERDLETGHLALVSRASGIGGAPANADSADPAISPAGRFVAFDSLATNLSPQAQHVLNTYRRGVLTPGSVLVP